MSFSTNALIELTNLLVWGQNIPNKDIFTCWCQGFRFSEHEPTALHQALSGPCAVISAVQAAIFRQILFQPDCSIPIAQSVDSMDILTAALVEIYETITPSGSLKPKYTILYWDGSDNDTSKLQTDTSVEKSDFDCFMDDLKLIEANSQDELHALILSLITTFESKYGLLCFLYSCLITHGLEDIKQGMLGETETLIDSTFGSASQCLLNLLITGCPTPYLFDGKRDLSGFENNKSFERRDDSMVISKNVESMTQIKPKQSASRGRPIAAANNTCTGSNDSILSFQFLPKSTNIVCPATSCELGMKEHNSVRKVTAKSMQGITNQPKTGFLTLVESLRYCEVGWYLKNPSSPIWILGSENHFTVLASTNRDLVSVEQSVLVDTDLSISTSATDIPEPAIGVTLRKRANLWQAQREFEKLNDSSDAGFITYKNYETLLGRLGLPTDPERITQAKQTIDPDGMQIILRQPFLAYYYAEELRRENNPLPEFQVIHFNGLPQSNPHGKVGYHYGVARLLDPTDDTNPSGKTGLDRCLKTKWPTIELVWDGGFSPTLN